MGAGPEPRVAGSLDPALDPRWRPKRTLHHARIVWEGTEDDVRAHRVEVSGEALAGSSAPDFGGNPERVDPEELFVAALSACHMLWFLALARGRGIEVRAYEDEPEGELDGTRFARVALRPRIAFGGDPDPAAIQELHHQAHERCYIANSVSCPVEVEQR